LQMILDIEETFIVGEDAFFDSISTISSYGVTFEDDLTTGYFYAVDTEPDLQILDALHVYDVEHVVDKHKPSIIQIVWTDNGAVAFLLINNYCHAMFNFKEKAGYCRNALPANNNGWAKTKERKLTDELLKIYSI
jgi:hypothetical protein